jgi:uncharacterized membrane protein
MDNLEQVIANLSWWRNPRLLILLVILLVVVIVVAFSIFIFSQMGTVSPTSSISSTTPVAKKILTDQERAVIIQQLSASTTGTTSTETVSDKKKAAIIKQLSALSAAPKLSDDEKQKIINSLSN